MDCCNVSIPVFIETNLGTRLALPVFPDITAKELKRELERTHLDCFPEFGIIKVDALMVKQKSRCYHLSESLPLKYAFLGSNVTWFLQMDAHPSNIPDCVDSLKCNDNLNSVANVLTDSVELRGFFMSTHDKRIKCKRKKIKIQRSPYLRSLVLKIPAVVCFLKRKRKRKNVKTGFPGQGPIQRPLIEKETLCPFSTGAEVNRVKMMDADVSLEALSETFSDQVSVSGIIQKYFSDYDEVASSSGFPFTRVWNRHKEQLNSTSGSKCLYSQSDSPSSEAFREKCAKPEVGKRLLVASGSLGLTPSNQRSVLPLCRYSDGQSPFHKSTSTVRNLVFEMTEEGD